MGLLKSILGIGGDGGAGEAARIAAEGYREAAATYADEAEKARALQEKLYNDSVARNAEWHKAGVDAVRQMRRGISDKRFINTKLPVLQGLTERKDFASFETWRRSRGEGGNLPHVRSAFEHVQEAMADIRKDPGYEFIRREGQRAITQRLAAGGLSGSGAAARALARYNQGLADQQVDKIHARAVTEGQLMRQDDTMAYDRAIGEYRTMYGEDMDAFNRDARRIAFNNQNEITDYNLKQGQMNTDFATLQSLAGYGDRGTARTQAATLNYGSAATNTIMANAQAQALGIGGATQTLAQGVINENQWRRQGGQNLLDAGVKLAVAALPA